jgi:hypothetical protein
MCESVSSPQFIFFTPTCIALEAKYEQFGTKQFLAAVPSLVRYDLQHHCGSPFWCLGLARSVLYIAYAVSRQYSFLYEKARQQHAISDVIQGLGRSVDLLVCRLIPKWQ